FLPCPKLRLIRKEVLHRTVFSSRVTAGANLHRFQAVAGYLVQHLIQGEVVKDRIKNPNRYFSRRTRGQGIGGGRGLSAGRTAALHRTQMRTCCRRRQQPTRGGQEFSAACRIGKRAAVHERSFLNGRSVRHRGSSILIRSGPSVVKNRLSAVFL